MTKTPEEPQEQQLGEWRTNPFLDPQVRKKITELQQELMEERLFNSFEGKKLKWIEETYPEIIKQYEAIRELEKADESARADQHKFFGEIK